MVADVHVAQHQRKSTGTDEGAPIAVGAGVRGGDGLSEGEQQVPLQCFLVHAAGQVVDLPA
jgi:hypothetical protein